MPKLPSAEDVFGRRPIPTPSTNIRGYSTGQDAQAAMRSGQALENMGQQIGDFADRRKKEINKFEVARSQAYALRAYTELEGELLNDPDYEGHNAKYQTISNEINKNALNMISDPSTREMYAFDLQDIQTRGYGSVQKIIYNKYNDRLRGEHVSMQDNLVRAATDNAANGDLSVVDLAVQKNEEALDALYKSGAIDYETAEKSKLAFRDQVAVTAFTAMPITEQQALVAGVPKSVRYKNPGNIRDPNTGEFVRFSSEEEGLAAMRNDLLIKISGRSKVMKGKPTLANLIHTWAPPSENDTENYTKFVSEKSGIDRNAVLTESDIDKIMPAMIQMEGGQKAAEHFGNLQKYLSPETQLKLRNSVASQVKENEDQVVLAFLDRAIAGEELDMTEPSFAMMSEANKNKIIEYHRMNSGQVPKTLAEENARDERFFKFLDSVQTGEIDPASLKSSDLVELSQGLNPEDFKKVQDMVVNAKTGAQGDVAMGLINDVTATLIPASSIAKGAATLSDLSGANREAYVRKQNAFKRTLLSKIEQFKSTNRKAPSPEEVYQLGDELMKEIVLKQPGYFSGTRELPAVQSYEFFDPTYRQQYVEDKTVIVPTREYMDLERELRRTKGSTAFDAMSEEDKRNEIEEKYIMKLITGDM